MKKLQYLLVCILIFTIVACSSKNNDITNPINDASLYDTDNNTRIITTSSFTVKGIDAKYSGSWAFFNADDKGNIAVDITISDGGVSGLVISNGQSQNTVSFKKDNIYSKPKKEDNQYYDRYFGYIISDGTWVGEIHFPIYDDETVGYVYVTNKSTSQIIIGMIDKASEPKDIFQPSFYGEYKADKRSVKIERTFITYYEDNQVKVKIPASFFQLSKDEKNHLGYAVFYGPLYSGVFINTSNTKITEDVTQLNFIYVDYNNMLEIKLKEDGTPISAKYNKKTTIISSEDLTYTKE